MEKEVKRISLLVGILCLLFFVILYCARKDLRNLYQSFFGKSVSHVFQTEPQNNSSISEEIKIIFLDIGQGDATLIEFPDGKQMLVDCSIDSRILEALGRVMSFQDRHIDYLVATHPDQDHYGGCVDVLGRYKVDTIIFNGYEKGKSAYFDSFLQAIQDEKAQYIKLEKEQEWSIASSSVHFLFPDEKLEKSKFFSSLSEKKRSNNGSVVFLLQYGTQKVLMTGDMEVELEEYLLEKYKNILDVDVLKVGHHGSQTSSGQDFLNVLTPEYSIISSGKNNEYGHPSLRVLKRLERIHSNVWRTDMMGDIIVMLTPTSTYVQKK